MGELVERELVEMELVERNPEREGEYGSRVQGPKLLNSTITQPLPDINKFLPKHNKHPKQLTSSSLPPNLSKLPFAAPPSIPNTLTPAPLNHATSAHSVRNFSASNGSSFSVIFPGPSFRWIAAMMTCVTPVFCVISGSSDTGAPELSWCVCA